MGTVKQGREVEQPSQTYKRLSLFVSRLQGLYHANGVCCLETESSEMYISTYLGLRNPLRRSLNMSLLLYLVSTTNIWSTKRAGLQELDAYCISSSIFLGVTTGKIWSSDCHVNSISVAGCGQERERVELVNATC